MSQHLTRRTLLTGLAIASPGAALAFGSFEFDPADLVPRYYRLSTFLRLDENDIHRVHLAIKRNRTVVIEGYTPSESKAIIKRARQDWPATRQELLKASGR